MYAVNKESSFFVHWDIYLVHEISQYGEVMSTRPGQQ